MMGLYYKTCEIWRKNNMRINKNKGVHNNRNITIHLGVSIHYIYNKPLFAIILLFNVDLSNCRYSGITRILN